MKVLRVLLFVVVGIILLYLILALIGPSEVEFERSIEIDAPQEVVWEHVNSLEDMNQWSPWSDLDTSMQESYSGEEGEVGSKHEWESDVDTLGKGSQEITEINPNEKITTHLVFKEPRESEADAWVRLESLGPNKTEAHWGFRTEVDFLSRPIMLFMDLEEMLSDVYNEGLENLKEWVESGDMEDEMIEYEVMEYYLEDEAYMVKRDTVSFSDMEKQYQEVGQSLHMAMEEGTLSATGPLVGIYYTWDTVNMKTYMAIGVPTSNEEAIEGFELIEMEEQQALLINHYGDYSKTGHAHTFMAEYATKNNIEFQGPAIERYVTDPSEQPDTSKWLTEIIYPIVDEE